MNEHHYHAVIWIDHREARVFHFGATDVERLVLRPDNPTRPIHHEAKLDREWARLPSSPSSSLV